ncbi:D-alanyl-D-alanine carboxypeptidase [Candidatus Uhrbacteria bacterium]|nr:D-alanyl-D-alanine carboxypeptidase [Candidatus Uhrbacteria bacterium]
MNGEEGGRKSGHPLFLIHDSLFRRCALVLVALAMTLTPAKAWGKTAVPHKPSAPSSFVLDLSTETVQVSDRAELVRPIASLTKLMTAMVLLDAKADLERTVTYDSKRHYAYKNWMKFGRGDTLRGRDLFLAMLVGSQNIPARMLVNLTPMSETQFIAAMNAKARSLGLAQTRFHDVHGLSPKNVSTAPEVARLLDIALTYPDIQDALGRSEATVAWQTRRGKRQERLFHHTNTLLQREQRFATEASKTGYLDEAGDTIAMRIRDPKSGHQFIVVTLGEPRRALRFPLAKRLADRVMGSQRIAGARIHE